MLAICASLTPQIDSLTAECAGLTAECAGLRRQLTVSKETLEAKEAALADLKREYNEMAGQRARDAELLAAKIRRLVLAQNKF